MISNYDQTTTVSSSELSIEYRSITDLTPNPRTARKHPRRKIRRLAAGIKKIGWTKPIVIDANGIIIAGNACFEAAKLNGMDRVPTVRLEGLTEDQIRAHAIADNRLAEIAGWDEPILAIELLHLLSVDCAGFDVTMTGFEIPEIDLILERVKDASVEEEPVPEPDLNASAISQPGDLWNLGKHRVLCGNALDETSYKNLMGRHRASAVFCDGPFNVPIDGHATGNGAIHHREFPMAAGEMTDVEFLCFLSRFQALLVRYSINNSVHYQCIDWRHIDAMISAGKQNYDELLNICVWVKDNGGMGSFYRSQHELIAVFRNGKGQHRNNVQLGKFGRNRTNVWHYPGVQTMSKQGEGNLLILHPTVKPIAMVADAILDCTAREEIVLDAFLGSGTTLMAAERVGRICYAIEIDPHYVDVAIRRWQNYTGQAAIHAVTGKRFDEVQPEMEVVRA
jgi:hypothetical protein